MGHRILPRPSLVAMSTKFGTKWPITWLLLEIPARFLCVYREFSGLGHRMMPMKFYPDPPWLPWQQNLRQRAIIRIL